MIDSIFIFLELKYNSFSFFYLTGRAYGPFGHPGTGRVKMLLLVLFLQGILIISKHDLQILYALRISFSTSTKCLIHNSSFSLLYLQYPILDGFCNLNVKRFSASLNPKKKLN